MAQHGRKSKSPRYSDLPDWAKPDSGHKVPSKRTDEKAKEHRESVKGGAANPGVGAPEPEPTPTPEPPAPPAQDVSWNPKGVSAPVGGNVSFLAFLVIIMVAILEWNNIVTPFFDVLWNGKSAKSKSPNWISGLGIAVFGFIIIALSSINDDMAGLMMIVVLGMITVYMVENKGGAFTTFFNWLQQQQSSTSTGSATGATPGHGAVPIGTLPNLTSLLQSNTSNNNSAQTAQKG